MNQCARVQPERPRMKQLSQQTQEGVSDQSYSHIIEHSWAWLERFYIINFDIVGILPFRLLTFGLMFMRPPPKVKSTAGIFYCKRLNQ